MEERGDGREEEIERRERMEKRGEKTEKRGERREEKKMKKHCYYGIVKKLGQVETLKKQ